MNFLLPKYDDMLLVPIQKVMFYHKFPFQASTDLVFIKSLIRV